MEFVEGDTLSSLIDRGPIPLDRALQYAIQIVDALAAAHARASSIATSSRATSW